MDVYIDNGRPGRLGRLRPDACCGRDQKAGKCGSSHDCSIISDLNMPLCWGEPEDADEVQRAKGGESLGRGFDGQANDFEVLRVVVDQGHAGDQRGRGDQNVTPPAEQSVLARFSDPVRAL